MGPLLMALLTGIALPVVMMMLNRHYKANPNKWEAAIVAGVVGLVGVVGGFWIMGMGVAGDGSLIRFLVVVACGWTVLIGLACLVFAWSEGAEAVKETRAKG